MQEQWKQVDGWPHYEISNLGRIRSNSTMAKGRIMNASIKNGYYGVSLYCKGVSKTGLIHRLVAGAFCEKKEGCDVVNHIDKNRLNNRADNLEWGTQKDNIHHAMQFENWTVGENHGMAKLTREQVLYIKSQPKGSIKLARELNVSYASIKKIRAGKHWKQVN